MANGKKNGNKNGNRNKNTGNGKTTSRASRSVGLANGARHALTESSVSKRASGNAQLMRKYGLDAFHPIHVPLPRAVAPYLTVRTVKAFTSQDKLMLFGTMMETGGQQSKGTLWDNTVAIGVSDLTTPLNSGTGFAMFRVPIPGTESNGFLECVPAALSVQIMNDSALQTADGVFYAGRMKSNITSPDSSDNRTVLDLANNLVSFAPPRILMGSSLVLGAVQINAIPGDMSSLSSFTPIKAYADAASTNWVSNRNFEGFNPMYLYNPDGKKVQYLVSVEWRVRVSPFNPMSSSVVGHKPTSDTFWSDIIETAGRIGHGVQDVAQYLEGLA
jgi:hypothetical protein